MAHQMEEMRQILVANNLTLPANRVGEASSEVQVIRLDAVAWDDPKGKKKWSCNEEVESQGDNRIIILGKHKNRPYRSIFDVVLRHG